ncbi:MAG: hypothetical protein ACMUIG_06890 [Thermoplasmatota archaeon]
MGYKIALYHDDASGERYEEKAFIKTGIRYEKIGPRDMAYDVLSDYDVVFLPGAFPLKKDGKGGFFAFLNFLRRIGREYRSPIRKYVHNGGGLIGVCASVAMLGSSITFPYYAKPFSLGIKPLGLFDFHATYGPKAGVVDLEPIDYKKPPEAVRTVNEVLGEYSDDRFSSLYFRGPAMTYGRDSGIIHHSLREGKGKMEEIQVAKYIDEAPELNGKGAIAYKEAGRGKVISCSVHPEFSTWDLFDSMIEVVARK